MNDPGVVPQPVRGTASAAHSPQGASGRGGVFEVPGRADVVLKIFRTPAPHERAERLRTLVALPDTMDAADRAVLRDGSCWPLAAATEGDAVVGCLLPRAPEKFVFARTAPSGRPQHGYLEIDWLANANEVLERRGIPPQSLRDRAAVCLSVTRVAAVLEKHDLVYSDWSYSNAFWCVADHTAYVIDVDGCTLRVGPNVQQPGWEDPLTPSTSDADTYVDRYRLALLTARCLTGRRKFDHVVAEFQSGGGLDELPGLRDALLRMLLAPERKQRPPVSELLGELEGVVGE
ncbi:hypothetical protein A8W25_27600 [Streptomyces sp. ERV7]|uniref:hypothetical protein n=1 Tax=Streptomyces sp. ERV7 TaxID=1322334 RepID=UPI0007F397CD|nr:hypothetical protein [Streptomyces sp. ERV7]OAR23263.1 hypothetical protein A8W25_27600 [Streptomyces sp. ERV7]